MSDIARGGLNQAVIAIEEARGALSSAIDRQQQLQDPPGARRLGLAIGSGAGTLARKFQPHTTCRGHSGPRCPPGGFLRADPRCHRPAVGGLDRRAGRARRRRARVHRAYDELDRRSGGELRALQAFGELREQRYGTALGAAGELPARRLLVVSAGHAEDLDRETARKFAARAIRRLISRDVKAIASGSTRWPTRSTATSRSSPTSSREAWSRAVSSPRRSTARTATARRRSSTSWC